MKAIRVVFDNTAAFALMLKISGGPYWTGLPVKMGWVCETVERGFLTYDDVGWEISGQLVALPFRQDLPRRGEC